MPPPSAPCAPPPAHLHHARCELVPRVGQVLAQLLHQLLVALHLARGPRYKPGGQGAAFAPTQAWCGRWLRRGALANRCLTTPLPPSSPSLPPLAHGVVVSSPALASSPQPLPALLLDAASSLLPVRTWRARLARGVVAFSHARLTATARVPTSSRPAATLRPLPTLVVVRYSRLLSTTDWKVIGCTQKAERKGVWAPCSLRACPRVM